MNLFKLIQKTHLKPGGIMNWLGYGEPIKTVAHVHTYLADEDTGKVRSFSLIYHYYDAGNGRVVCFKDPLYQYELPVSEDMRREFLARLAIQRDEKVTQLSPDAQVCTLV